MRRLKSRGHCFFQALLLTSPGKRAKATVSNLIQRFLHRLAYVAPGGYSIRPTIHRWRGVKIGKNVWISQYVYIDEVHPEAVTIGDNATIGIRVSIIAHLYWGKIPDKEGAGAIVIGPDVFIGPHSVILPGVSIGEGAVIQAGSVVSRDVPPRTFFGNPPAQPLAEVTTSLTPGHSYLEFVRGLRPLRRKE
jgi:acetyltransferase-like isoleucine patch superfamily enzyme